jgi:dolichyl-diphosphooligosaccharide--protein glycosyltransferase
MSLSTGYFTDTYYLNDPGTPENSGLIGLINQPYYSTMIARLHNFDGSLAIPGQVAFAVISTSDDTRTIAEVNSIEFLDHTDAWEKLNEFESRPRAGTTAVLGGFLIDSPLEKVGALHHYRLVYEDAAHEPDGDYDYGSMVKVFEYVPGARLAGEGIIEAKIRTNIGRTFMYRQEAEDGVFILPYSTEGGTYPVTTIGPYTLVSTGRTIEITEDAVKWGKTVS